MTETSTQTVPRPPFYRTKRFYLLVAGLTALIVTPTGVYYALSYNSVNGSTVQLTSVRRSVSHSFFSESINSVTYYVEAHVWSWAGSVDTRVTNPIFSLSADSFFISSEEGLSGTFKPYGYLTYSLSFTTLDSSVARTVGQASSNHVVLTMNAPLSSGIYQNQITVSDGNTWTF